MTDDEQTLRTDHGFMVVALSEKNGDYRREVTVQELIDRIAEAVVTKLAATQRYPVIEEEGGLITDA